MYGGRAYVSSALYKRLLEGDCPPSPFFPRRPRRMRTSALHTSHLPHMLLVEDVLHKTPMGETIPNSE